VSRKRISTVKKDSLYLPPHREERDYEKRVILVGRKVAILPVLAAEEGRGVGPIITEA
jgi:hypothetical protein